MGIGIFLHTQAYIFIGNSIVSTFCISSSQYRIVLHLQQPPAMARSKWQMTSRLLKATGVSIVI